MTVSYLNDQLSHSSGKGLFECWICWMLYASWQRSCFSLIHSYQSLHFL